MHRGGSGADRLCPAHGRGGRVGLSFKASRENCPNHTVGPRAKTRVSWTTLAATAGLPGDRTLLPAKLPREVTLDLSETLLRRQGLGLDLAPGGAVPGHTVFAFTTLSLSCWGL